MSLSRLFAPLVATLLLGLTASAAERPQIGVWMSPGGPHGVWEKSYGDPFPVKMIVAGLAQLGVTNIFFFEQAGRGGPFLHPTKVQYARTEKRIKDRDWLGELRILEGVAKDYRVCLALWGRGRGKLSVDLRAFGIQRAASKAVDIVTGTVLGTPTAEQLRAGIPIEIKYPNQPLILLDANANYRVDPGDSITHFASDGFLGVFGHAGCNLDRLTAACRSPLTAGLPDAPFAIEPPAGGRRTSIRSAETLILADGTYREAKVDRQPFLTFKHSGRGAAIYLVGQFGAKSDPRLKQILKNCLSPETLRWLCWQP